MSADSSQKGKHHLFGCQSDQPPRLVEVAYGHAGQSVAKATSSRGVLPAVKQVLASFFPSTEGYVRNSCWLNVTIKLQIREFRSRGAAQVSSLLVARPTRTWMTHSQTGRNRYSWQSHQSARILHALIVRYVHPESPASFARKVECMARLPPPFISGPPATHAWAIEAG